MWFSVTTLSTKEGDAFSKEGVGIISALHNPTIISFMQSPSGSDPQSPDRPELLFRRPSLPSNAKDILNKVYAWFSGSVESREIFNVRAPARLMRKRASDDRRNDLPERPERRTRASPPI